MCPPLPLLIECFVFPFILHVAGATLLFSVELFELQKKPLVKMPGNQFWIYVGIAAVVVLLIYELYKRATSKGEEKKPSSAKKKGSKKRK